MRRAAATPLLACLLATAGCGSERSANRHALTTIETVTVTTPTPAATVPAAATTTAPVLPPTPARTQTAPASAQPTPASVTDAPSGLAGAKAVLAGKGYQAVSDESYAPDDTLHVLIGADGGAEQAFFFKNDVYLGTDTMTPSRQVSVMAKDDTTVTLRYQLDGGSHQDVRFQLDQGKLVPVDDIPPADARQ